MVWNKNYKETNSWSTFAPNFEEIEENEVYVEQEDEFDVLMEGQRNNRKGSEEVVVDVLTCDRIYGALADSSEDESDWLIYLPTDPIPDRKFYYKEAGVY